MNKKLDILCVDDEPQILEGLRLHLKQRYIVHCAGNGAEGIQALQENKHIAVILSDMRMPVMDGAKFLNAARTVAPDSVRMLLTGYTDMQSAIAAVNEGQIFRFISKPCPPDQLLGAFAAAVTQHQLIVAEKVLLQETLLGCVESLAKVLSLTKPIAFGRALRVRAKVRAAVKCLHLEAQWQIEAAAILSQLGAVTLSEETLMRLNDGEEIDAAERGEVAASIDTSIHMLDGIPRLEPVIEILKFLSRSTHSPTLRAAGADSAGGLLRLVLEWDSLEARGHTQAEALATLSAGPDIHDRDMLDALAKAPATGGPNGTTTCAVGELLPGMVLAQDLVRRNGVVILSRGFEIDRGLLEHIQAFAGEMDDSPIRVTRAG